MRKYIILFILLTCFTAFGIGRNNRIEEAKKNIKFFDEVSIISGFYEGATGTVMKSAGGQYYKVHIRMEKNDAVIWDTIKLSVFEMEKIK
jgi:hypothetical protein